MSMTKFDTKNAEPPRAYEKRLTFADILEGVMNYARPLLTGWISHRTVHFRIVRPDFDPIR